MEESAMKWNLARQCGEVAALLFAGRADEMSALGENADGDSNSDHEGQFSTWVGVARDGRTWQRNLHLTIESDGDAFTVEVEIVDGEQKPVVAVGRSTVGEDALPDVIIALARAGLSAFGAEIEASRTPDGSGALTVR
jgi:hypothetical protein